MTCRVSCRKHSASGRGREKRQVSCRKQIASGRGREKRQVSCRKHLLEATAKKNDGNQPKRKRCLEIYTHESSPEQCCDRIFMAQIHILTIENSTQERNGSDRQVVAKDKSAVENIALVGRDKRQVSCRKHSARLVLEVEKGEQ